MKTLVITPYLQDYHIFLQDKELPRQTEQYKPVLSGHDLRGWRPSTRGVNKEIIILNLNRITDLVGKRYHDVREAIMIAERVGFILRYEEV